MTSLTVNEISEKYCLDSNERVCFNKYLENKFIEEIELINTDISFIDRWRDIYSYSVVHSVGEALNKYIIPKRTVDFIDEDGMRLEIYDSFAGEIPVVYIKNNEDFNHFITNAVYKGIIPENLSQTGASFISGKTTRFIVLSAKPYSNVCASNINMSSEEWQEKSMIIRREHECTHYFIKQIFGIARNNLHDELIADFFGIYEAFGKYKSEMFYKFMGVDGNSGGRLKFYTEDMSERLFIAVSEIAVQSAVYLEKYSKTSDFLRKNRKERIIDLCRTSLADMCAKA